ncbi:hypothetical protein Golax_009026 [Gossypium laxum]|uniref:CCHC-type domain-containing protein n=1 Tax=Gossypium laxum TaxID=34288 RepID=A0A7J9ABP5_9ROSI|nr:hypothetical protein [Gossypium laxum]
MNEPLPTGDFVMGASDIVSNSDVGWATKKVRRWPDMPPDVDDPTVDGNDDDDYHKILTWGSWVIYGQYLTVRPWSPNFSTSQNEVDIQVFWVRLPGLPKGYYSSFLIWAIRKAIGPVIKLDERTGNACMGRFAQLAVCVDLKKSLISKVKRNGRVQQIEYESLSIVCFKCGLYGHNSKLCLTQKVLSPESESGKSIPVVEEAGGNPHVQMGSRILKPNNSNVGSFNYVGPNASVDNVTMSQIYVSGRNGNTSFKPVIVHSNLDKEKHKTVQATEKENASIILERENIVFLFGDMDNGRLRSSVHTLGEGDFQRDKPPDGRLVVHHPDTVELLEAIEWIVKQLERDTEGDVITDDRFGWAEHYGG